MNEDHRTENGAAAGAAGEGGLDKHDQVLAGLVVSLQIAAMQQMGKITNPATNAVERDLEQARSSIDLLEMLKVKCRGGTPPPLLEMIDRTVIELQMNYVDELAKQRAAADAEPDEAAPAEAAAEPVDEPVDEPAEDAPAADAAAADDPESTA
jgi:hypothetical protein